jgi:hypothetical protein
MLLALAEARLGTAGAGFSQQLVDEFLDHLFSSRKGMGLFIRFPALPG